MKEINDIILAYERAVAAGRDTALATVVHVEGSSYRRPGARMLIEDNGQLTGAISGGCLEGDALRKALLVMQQQRTMLVTYDTMDDDDAKFGVGLGCNGIIQVLIEPVRKKDDNIIALLRAAVNDRQPAVLVTLFSLADKKTGQQGTCLLQKNNGTTFGSIHPELPIRHISADITNTFANKISLFKNYISQQTDITAFVEFIPPQISLVIAGAGNDIVPLVQMADVLGWKTTVIDGRPALAKSERFVSSCRVLLLDAAKILDNITVDDYTIFLLMTHNYNYDFSLLKSLLLQPVVFIGILGPRKKLARILCELQDENIILTEQQLASIHSPMGLDIGAETPQEIALSILAEIKTVLSQKNGQLLKDKIHPIHADTLSSIQKINIP